MHFEFVAVPHSELVESLTVWRMLGIQGGGLNHLHTTGSTAWVSSSTDCGLSTGSCSHHIYKAVRDIKLRINISQASLISVSYLKVARKETFKQMSWKQKP